MMANKRFWTICQKTLEVIRHFSPLHANDIIVLPSLYIFIYIYIYTPQVQIIARFEYWNSLSLKAHSTIFCFVFIIIIIIAYSLHGTGIEIVDILFSQIHSVP